tara:strand:+ start:1567 stop:2553 length:987 start_codon:yes stop_codon:yes gene_type:complete
MKRKNIVILITRKLPEKIEKKLKDDFTVLDNKTDKKLSYNELKKKIGNVDVLIPCISDTIDSSIIKSGKRLKLIANFGNGVDNLDLVTANEENVLVTNTPDVLTQDTADLVLTMVLMISRKVIDAQKKLTCGKWNGWGPSETMGQRIKGKNVGIIGMGRIGRAVAQRLNILGVNIYYHNRNRLSKSIERNHKAKYFANLDLMISKCDIISIHCPYTPETFHLMSKKRLNLLRKNCIVINTSRGEIIDEQALANLLFKKKIGGAGLDVFEHEPQITQKLFESENVILLPHISSATIESRVAMGERVIRNIRLFVNGKRPPDIIRKIHYE